MKYVSVNDIYDGNIPEPLFSTGHLTIENERTREIRIGRNSNKYPDVQCFSLERKEPHRPGRGGPEGWTKVRYLSRVVNGQATQAESHLEAFEKAIDEAVAEGFPAPDPAVIPSLEELQKALPST